MYELARHKKKGSVGDKISVYSKERSFYDLKEKLSHAALGVTHFQEHLTASTYKRSTSNPSRLNICSLIECARSGRD